MKHEEAKNYICPRTIGTGSEGNCLGGICAVWRWAEPKWGAMEQRRGFCGLGGDYRYPLNPENEKVGG